MRELADRKSLYLVASVPQAAQALGDPFRLKQVMTNLLGNAIKFTAEGSVAIDLEVRETGPEAVAIDFRIVDTGIGIAPDRLPHIFDEFTQANYDIGLKYGGTGLGLAISKKLVELYGSRIAVESELGRGTTFAFGLRLETPAAAETGGSAGEPGDRQELKGLRILLADDNEVNVLVLTGFLRKWGVEVDAVRDGRQAVERVRQGDYDLVLMDLRMPELDGYAATRQIRALPDERYARLPIFAVSASTRMGYQHELDAAGFTEFVGKPISPDLLFAKIARHTGRGPA
jgi:CheY-like chemotaxis protein